MVKASFAVRNRSLPPAGPRRQLHPALAAVYFAALIATCVFAAVEQEAYDFGYGIKRIAPKFEADANTSFLADFSAGELKVVQAAGEGVVRCADPKFVPQGGVKGRLEVAGGANFNARAWTVEMLLRVPSGLDRGPNVTLMSWNAGTQVSSALVMSPVNISGYVRGTGQVRFDLTTACAGDGSSVQRNAADQWIYLAWGLEAKSGRLCLVIRDLDGDALLRRMEHISNASLPSAAKAGQATPQAAELLGAAQVEKVLIGSPEIEIKNVRISKTFREEVLVAQPGRGLSPGSIQVFTADQLDPKRAAQVAAARRMGYPGYNNHRTPTLNEYILSLSAQDPPFEVKLPNMKVGLYTFYVYGQIDPKGRKDLDRVWKPCPMRFELKDKNGKATTYGNLQLKQAFFNRLMQGFHFHIDEPGDYTAVFQISPKAQETAQITHLVLADRLADLPDQAIKTSQNMEKGPSNRLTALTEARKKRDEAIWNALPPLNLHMQVHGVVAAFRKPPASAKVGNWQTKALLGLAGYNWGQQAFAPLDFVNTDTNELFPAQKIVAGEPWPGQYADDGTGIFFSKAQFPELPHDIYYSPRAELLGQRYLVFLGALNDHEGYSKQATAYFQKGDPNDGHDAAMALVRVAYDWPALEMSFHELRLCTHCPDFEYNTDWTGARRNGKYYYRGWSGQSAQALLQAYDRLFPYINNNQLFADEVRRFVPWVKTPQDVIRLLDRYLVLASVRDARVDLIDKGSGIEELAGQMLGPHPLTADLFDLTRTVSYIHPASGRFQEMYATALTRDGMHYIGSFMVYALGEATMTLQRAALVADAKTKGVTPKMDLSDVNKYPKVRGAANFMIDVFVAGGFPMMVGDASGGPHTGLQAERIATANRDAFRNAFLLCGEPRIAWVLKNLLGDQRPEVAKAAQGVRNPYLHNPSRVLAGAGAAAVEMGVDETDVTQKTAAFMRLGLGQGHAHSDYLDVNFFAMGLPVAVDLACRNEGGNWSRPHAGWSLLHNHAIAHNNLDPKTDQQNGDAWLRAFAPPLLRGSYTEPAAGGRVDRDVMLMELGNSGQYYAFDVQRVQGAKYHTWGFHGCESDDLKLNVPMKDESPRWVDRTLAGTHKTGTATDSLQAVWTMTRQGREIKHDFEGGGVIKTAACEPAVLGKAYDPNKPPVHVRATLLGRQGDQVLQGNPFSQVYAYCFPFLWAQHEANGGETLYPAVYEWYRGDEPVVKSAEIVQKNPLTVRVLTASGQTDVYALSGESFSALSSDAKGLRWALLSGGDTLRGGGLTFKAAKAAYSTAITGIDYAKRTLTTKDPLPPDPLISVGNDGRWTCLQLKGKGTQFTFEDDLLIHEGEIQSLAVTGEDQIDVKVSQPLLFANRGNRRLSAFTMTNEDASWQFRGFAGQDTDWKGGKVVRKPAGAKLARDVFKDVNDDSFINLKTYEIGVGDTVRLPAAVTLRRGAGGYELLTNVPVDVEMGGAPAHLEPSLEWRKTWD